MFKRINVLINKLEIVSHHMFSLQFVHWDQFRLTGCVTEPAGKTYSRDIFCVEGFPLQRPDWRVFL